ncbi:non-ribosomal peptide synthetase [Streptomyces sp. AS58]|uniref:non-ribosomal peptide synthetase n=1 Tax=Streptomyces sp. AS58 TaxID=1519489 RepID=UPI00099D7AC0|nr:non-ribosomal peptide synthetase [Streptomyces sp. AS58]
MAGIPGFFRRSALRSPGAVAVQDAAGCLTYAQLDCWSDWLAARLLGRGRPGDVVAVCLPRGRLLIVALLAAVKAGMPYLPLSLDDPAARRLQLLNVSGARLVLVDESTAELMQPSDGIDSLLLGDELPEISDEESVLPDPVDRGDSHPVYVLFTSGSTGNPKGVLLPSGALVNRLLWMQEQFQFNSADRFLQKTPYTFDVSGWEFWNPLIAGATLVMLPQDAHSDPGEVARWINEQAITLCHFVPSMLGEFLRQPGAALCTSLRAVFCSGEALAPGHVRRFYTVLGATELYNLYGPTEAAIDVTWWHCPRDPALERTLLGHPVANCTLAVVGPGLAPVPFGETGELAIGGVPLAVGYLGAPELTARAFVEAPPWTGVRRLYLTGDLVRRTPGGLEYLGRRDSQVKIRGQRVELTAVEDALRELPDVTDAAAAAVSRGEFTDLCALVTPTEDSVGAGSDTAVDGQALRAALRLTLPANHVPTVVFPVEALPLSESGKVARSRVQEIIEERLEARFLKGQLAATTAMPTDDSEPSADRLWRTATGFLSSDATASFLDSGGHSLSAARLAGVLQEQYGIRVPLGEILGGAFSLARLRALIARARPGVATDAAADRDIELTSLPPHQRGLWTWSRLFPDCPAYNVRASLGLDGPVEVPALERALRLLVERHPVLRATFSDNGTDVELRSHRVEEATPVLRVGPAAEITDPVLDHVFRPDALPRLVAGLAHGPEGEATLLLAMDHLVADQHAMSLALGELATLYEGSDLPAPRSAWGHEPTRSQGDLDFWRERLRNAPERVELPFRRPRSASPSYRGDSRDVSLGPRLTEVFEEFCAREGVTPFATVLTAFCRRLALWTGSDDLVVGVPVSGRRSEAEHASLGNFMRTVPVRLSPSADALEPQDVRRSAQELYTSAEHASVPFDEIVASTGRSRTLSYNPLFQVWCNDVSHADLPDGLGTATAKVLNPPDRWSLFDIGMYLYRDRETGMRLRLAYGTDVWDEPTASEFLGQCADDLAALVGGAAIAPSAREGELRPLPHELGHTNTDLARAVLSHARSTPARPALVAADGQTVSYDRLADHIGHVRSSIAAAAERTAAERLVVSVSARSSVGFAAQLFGCWLADAVPLLLDPGLPDAWRAEAERAAGVGLVLEPTDLSRPVDRSTTRHDTRQGDAARAPGHLLTTSGTTGVPAVVAVPVDALPGLLAGYRTELGLTADDVFALLAAPGHDPVFRDLVLPLALGATVHLPRPEDRDPRGLVRWLDAVRATVLHVTPSQIQLAAAAEPVRVLDALKAVVLHGETLRYGTVEAARRLAPNARLYNLYGTTETPQAASLRLIGAEETGEPGDPVPLGPTAPGRAVEVVGPRGARGVGILGEMVVRGYGLGLGSPGDPRFSRDGEADGADAGLSHGYRTGDLARQRPSGLIEPAGRADRQSAVRGHRVQLDGVESVLGAVPGVESCHVAVDERTVRLLAWWTGSARVTDAEIRAVLRSRLPEPSVPLVFHVDALPLTPRGKIDTRELIRRTVPEAPTDVAKPLGGTALVELLLSTTAALHPGLELGPDDNLFAAGLSSLSLLRLFETVRSEAGDVLTIADFFRYPTARDLAGRAAGTSVPRRLAARQDTEELSLRRALRRRASQARPVPTAREVR